MNGGSASQQDGELQLIHDLQLRHMWECVPRDPPLLDARVHVVNTLLRVIEAWDGYIGRTVNSHPCRTIEKERNQPRLRRKRHLNVRSFLLVGLGILHIMLRRMNIH